jgi:hypothetical protein
MAFLKSSQITGLSAKDVDVRGFTQADSINLGDRAYTEHEVLLADAYSITGDVTISDNLILAKLSDDGEAITVTGDASTTRTISGSGSLEGSTFAQTPNASLTGMTGTLDNSVQDNVTRLGTVTTGSIGSGVTGFTGVKEMDWWQLTVSATGNINPITSNLERCLAGGFTPIGTGMTESGGVFSFPSTGFWEVQYHWLGWTGSASSRYCTAHIQYTPNNGSNWYTFGRSTMGVYNYTNNTECNNHSSGYIDVTNVSTHKVRFYSNYENQGMYCYSSGGPSATTSPGTTFMFKRLGDR